jgi:hypothetical protein
MSSSSTLCSKGSKGEAVPGRGQTESAWAGTSGVGPRWGRAGWGRAAPAGGKEKKRKVVLKIWPVVNGLTRGPHDLAWHEHDR